MSDSMLESLRRCATCRHLRSTHGACGCAARNHAPTSHDANASTLCSCKAYVPGELSAEGERYARAQGVAS